MGHKLIQIEYHSRENILSISDVVADCSLNDVGSYAHFLIRQQERETCRSCNSGKLINERANRYIGLFGDVLLAEQAPSPGVTCFMIYVERDQISTWSVSYVRSRRGCSRFNLED